MDTSDLAANPRRLTKSRRPLSPFCDDVLKKIIKKEREEDNIESRVDRGPGTVNVHAFPHSIARHFYTSCGWRHSGNLIKTETTPHRYMACRDV